MRQILRPDLWRKSISRPSLTWMVLNLCNGCLYKLVNMAGDLQHNVRALMLRASSAMPVSDGRDEAANLRKQLRHQKQIHREMQTMLKNQALTIETFQSKWQMAGQEAHAFLAKTRSQSEDFVQAELMAVQLFEDSLQRQYDGQLRSHVHA